MQQKNVGKLGHPNPAYGKKSKSENVKKEKPSVGLRGGNIRRKIRKGSF